MIRLIRTFNRHVDVVGLIFAELSEFRADSAEVQTSHHLIKVLGQHIHLFAVFTALSEQFDLS